ncbi:MAG: YtxH domain-containing protein [Lewinellaceae bacterium]|nr:YtxH domain-containing protein [Lewinellaceae bacterium]
MKNETIPRGLSFLAGAATGLALGLYLNSERGSALREQLVGHLDDLLQHFGESAQEQLDDLMATLNTVVERGLLQVADLQNNLEDTTDSIGDELEEVMEEAETNFENGMETARRRLLKKFAAAGLEPDVARKS